MSAVPESDSNGEEMASGFVPTALIEGEDDVDTTLLRKMAEEANVYISSFSWCREVVDSYLAAGVGGIFAIFFFRIRPNRPGIDPWIWIVVGDIPSAYLPLADCKSPAEVFRTYILGMSKWIEFARKGQTGTAKDGVPPVNVPATPEMAEEVSQRLYGLTQTVGPLFGEYRREPYIQ